MSNSSVDNDDTSTYFGYSTAVGNNFVAAGMPRPRGANFKGTVGYTLKKYLIDLNKLQLTFTDTNHRDASKPEVIQVDSLKNASNVLKTLKSL